MENCKIEPIIMDNAEKMIKEPKTTILSLFPDPGCQETLIAKSLVPLLGLQVDQSRTKRIQGITGGPTDPCYGSTSFQISYDGQVTNVMGLVTDTIKDEIILSLKALQRLGIVHEEYPRSQWSVTKKATLDTDVNEMDLAQELELLKEKYREVFDHESELKIMNGTPVKIELKDDVIIKPMHVNVPRRVAYAQEKASNMN